jgi:hypothetical protein
VTVLGRLRDARGVGVQLAGGKSDKKKQNSEKTAMRGERRPITGTTGRTERWWSSPDRRAHRSYSGWRGS